MAEIGTIHDNVLHFLTVEDNVPYREGFKSIFNEIATKEQIQFTFEEAESGEKAIEKVKQKDYNIIFMDYNLGRGITGVEAIIRILQLKPQIKILGLSSHEELFFVTEMIDAGASGYLLKHFDKGELIAAVSGSFR